MEHMNHDDMPGMQHHGDSESAGNASDDMSMGSSSSMGMAMTFFQSINTSLLFHDAKPATVGQYAGACIVLALLGILACVLLHFKGILQRTVWTNPVPHDVQPLLEDDEKAASKSHNTVAELPPRSLRVRTEVRKWLGAWRSTSLFQRAGMASYEILLASLGYIL